MAEDTLTTDRSDAQLPGILVGVGVLRAITLMWATAVVIVDAGSGVLTRPRTAFTILGVMGLWTGFTLIAAWLAPKTLTRPVVIALDLLLAALVIAADGHLYDDVHPQSFGSAWPVAAIISTGVILGWAWGLGAGATLGAVNLGAAVALDRAEGRLLALSGTIVLFAATGAVAGFVAQRLRAAESQVADARAREEVARTLHDGVLQTLAVVQRRSDDDALVTMARDQEHDLRDFIAGTEDQPSDLIGALRTVVARSERDHRIRCDLIVIDSASATAAATVEAMVGAVGEAITNAGKHANPDRVTVCVDAPRSGGVQVTVKDDGGGVDVESFREGTGWSKSIRGRLAEVDGTAELSSTEDGTEVTLWAP